MKENYNEKGRKLLRNEHPANFQYFYACIMAETKGKCRNH